MHHFIFGLDFYICRLVLRHKWYLRKVVKWSTHSPSLCCQSSPSIPSERYMHYAGTKQSMASNPRILMRIYLTKNRGKRLATQEWRVCIFFFFFKRQKTILLNCQALPIDEILGGRKGVKSGVKDVRRRYIYKRGIKTRIFGDVYTKKLDQTNIVGVLFGAIFIRNKKATIISYTKTCSDAGICCVVVLQYKSSHSSRAEQHLYVLYTKSVWQMIPRTEFWHLI